MITSLYCCKEYKVDSDGFIISKRDHKPMKPSLSPHGYLTTTVMINGKRKTMPIHSAIAKSFLGDKTTDGLVINHKDGNKQNNHLDNLEWVTPSENMVHATNIIHAIKSGKDHPCSKQVIGYDKKTNEIKYAFDSLGEAARHFAEIRNKDVYIIKALLWRVINGQKKSYLGCRWRYA